MDQIFVETQRLAGTLVIEEPANVAPAHIAGDCAVGAFSYCNHRCEFTDVDIGRYCSIGQEVLINPGHHYTGLLTTNPIASDPSGISSGMRGLPAYGAAAMTHLVNRPPAKTRVTIGHDVWIGARSIILAGVNVGTGAVIGAGSVVSRDVEPYAIVGGIPARLIRYRVSDRHRHALLASEWWKYDLSKLPHRDFSEIDQMLCDIGGLRGDIWKPVVHRFPSAD